LIIFPISSNEKEVAETVLDDAAASFWDSGGIRNGGGHWEWKFSPGPPPLSQQSRRAQSRASLNLQSRQDQPGQSSSGSGHGSGVSKERKYRQGGNTDRFLLYRRVGDGLVGMALGAVRFPTSLAIFREHIGARLNDVLRQLGARGAPGWGTEEVLVRIHIDIRVDLVLALNVGRAHALRTSTLPGRSRFLSIFRYGNIREWIWNVLWGSPRPSWWREPVPERSIKMRTDEGGQKGTYPFELALLLGSFSRGLLDVLATFVEEGRTRLQEVLDLLRKRNIFGGGLRPELGAPLASFVVIPGHEESVLLRENTEIDEL
jgi:hypothetical protein